MRWESSVFLLLSLFFSCSYPENDVGDLQTGAFAYSQYNRSGDLVVRGTIAFDEADSTITGYWLFENGRSGDLTGTESNGQIDLNLNPHLVDSNLLLHGTLSGETFSGEWEMIGFPGVTDRGTFIAIRN